MTILRTVIAALLIVAVYVRPAAGADGPSLKSVLQRAGSYVARFERDLSSLVAEEHYVQEARRFPAGGCPPGTGAGTYQATLGCEGRLIDPMRTELRSELLLVRSSRAYVQVRDVFEVDGRPVRDRDERVAAVLDRAGAIDEAMKQRVLDENARFNIGDVLRTMNVPLVALQILEQDSQWRFRFKRTSDRTARLPPAPSGRDDVFRVSTEVWTIEFREHEPRTLIRTPDGQDLPARGRLWIEPDTGRVLMTELRIDKRGLRAEVTVSFQSVPLHDMLLPVEMREHYEAGGSRIDCMAAYGHFRQLR
jgi:hypothetical protein